MSKEAKTKFAIHSLLSKRWSPRAFKNQSISREILLSLFEAARWSPSAFNDQPWYFIIGNNNDKTFLGIFETLVEFNQLWAKNAPVLVLSCGRKNTQKGDPNNSFKYDVGQAVAHLSIQATSHNLYVHQMTGFKPEKATEIFEIPDEFEALSVFAIGYMGDASMLDPRMQKPELAERERKTFDKFIFQDKFGKKSNLLTD